ncbi:MAG: hypothetical protein R6X13_00220 [bacterium]
MSGSEGSVAAQLAGLGVEFRTDIAYVFIVPPMNAARLEGGINPLIGHLRRAGINTDVLVLAISDRRRAAERYLMVRSFDSDHSLVVGSQFLNSFVFSSGELRVPYAAKFRVPTGEMLAAVALTGSFDSTAVALFLSDTSRPRSQRPGIAASLARPARSVLRPRISRIVKLFDADSFPLSDASCMAVNPSRSLLALSDNLTNFVYVYSLASGSLVNVLRPDSSEETQFVDVPALVLQMLRQNNILNSMYFSCAFQDDTTLLVAASLPRVTQTASGDDLHVEYYNAPVIVTKSASAGRLASLALIQPLPDSVQGSYAHPDASFLPEHGLALMPFNKGWPSGSEMLSDSTPARLNPFREEFYERDAYQFAAFNLSGKFVRFWGRLSARFQKLRLGYSVGGGLARSDGSYCYLSDQSSGTIDCYDWSGELRDSIRFVDDPPPVRPATDWSSEPLAYLFDAYRLNVAIRVTDFAVSNGRCYVLYLSDGQPAFSRLNMSTRRSRRFALPARLRNGVVKYSLLRPTPSGVIICGLIESPEETYYVEFAVPDP